jgi:hypothetical protein
MRFTSIRVLSTVSALLLFAQLVTAQAPRVEESGSMLPWLLMIVALVGGGLFYLNRRKKRANPYSYESRLGGDSAKTQQSDFEKAFGEALDAATTKRNAVSQEEPSGQQLKKEPDVDQLLNAQLYQLALKKMQFSQLPINSFMLLTEPKAYDLLPLSSDATLLGAIDEANDESEHEESAREATVRVLAGFKTRNSVDALAQVALYDLSSNIRAKAVNALADFDHESVFEAVLLACADPTREVRAAAARALFKLSFDRAAAWKRIISSRDTYRMSHAARAASEAGLVERSFDRLLSADMKIAYEAFALVSLLIRANETKQIFEAIKTTRDDRVRLALLHVLAVAKDERTFPVLQEMAKNQSFSEEVTEKIDEVIETFEPALA